MGLFGFGDKDKDLRATGARVPAVLVSIDDKRVGDGMPTSSRVYTMRWEARTAHGATIPFTVKATWCPPEGIWLEAVCDEAAGRAALVLDLRKLPKEMSRYGATVAESEDAAAVLRGVQAGGGLMRSTMAQYGLQPNLRRLKG